MPYELDNRLVIGVVSSAVFDLNESDAVFRREGKAQYRRYSSRTSSSTINLPTSQRRVP